MPYPNEHAARVADESDCGAFKRMNQGQGVSLILCKKGDKMEAVSYRFAKDKFTVAQAKAWLDKHNLRADKFEEASDEKMEAKLSLNASRALDGKVWSAGMHHVFVNDKPARVYVPESTIIETFNQMKSKLEDEGSIGIGIDHLSDSILADNEVLAKLNLLDVGAVSSIVTDGNGIFIRESNITNDAIRTLHEQGELSSYSIVGGMDAKPCPTGKADYIVEHIDVERIDIVGEGGCESCKVGVQPSDIILTAKLNKNGEDNMVDEHEAPVEEVEAVAEEAVEEQVVEEVEVVEEEVVEEVEEEPSETVEVEEEPSEMEALLEEVKTLKEEIKSLGGKKPVVKSDDAEDAVNELIKAGKALPKMKAGLMATYNADPEAFATLAASMPKMVQMKAQAKLAKKAKDEEVEKQKQAEADAQKAQLESIFRVKL